MENLLAGRQAGESDKQFLVALYREGKIGSAALRAMAVRLDELKAEGREDALRATVREYEAGKLTVSKEAAKRDRGPALADAPKGIGAKQTILWLHQQGSISKEQMRAAARVLNEQAAKKLPFDVAAALFDAGALAVLSESDIARFEESRGGDEGNEDDPAPVALTTDPKALAGFLHTSTLPTVQAAVKATEDRDALMLAHQIEKAHPSYQGGRAGVLNAIEERLGELKVPEPKV